MTTELETKKCVPCKGGQPPMTREKASEMIQLVPQWELALDSKQIARNYVMKNFIAAVDFINKIKDLAEEQDHHPDLHLTGYRNLAVELSTHKIDGLSENDFILAAKINKLSPELKTG